MLNSFKLRNKRKSESIAALIDERRAAEASAAAEIELLRPYRAYGPETYTNTARIRAEARLEQILSTPPQLEEQLATSRQRISVPNRKRRLAIRWAAIPVLAGGILAAVTLAPTHTGVVPEAFATWTAVPTPLTDARLENAVAACTAEVNQQIRTPDWHQQLPNQPAPREWVPGDPVLAETRGNWGLLDFDSRVDEVGDHGYCLVRFTGVTPTVVSIYAGSSRRGVGGSIGGSVWASGGNMASSAMLVYAEPLSLADDTVAIVTAQEGRVEGQGQFGILFGRVGADVTGLVLDTQAFGQVEATVSEGRFVAWWPEAEGEEWGTLGWGLDRFVMGAIVTLSDGTVLPNHPIYTYDGVSMLVVSNPASE